MRIPVINYEIKGHEWGIAAKESKLAETQMPMRAKLADLVPVKVRKSDSHGAVATSLRRKVPAHARLSLPQLKNIFDDAAINGPGDRFEAAKKIYLRKAAGWNNHIMTASGTSLFHEIAGHAQPDTGSPQHKYDAVHQRIIALRQLCSPAQAHAEDADGQRPIDVALQRSTGKREIAQAFVDARLVHPVHVAAALDNPATIMGLINGGVSVAQGVTDKWTPLHYAAKYNTDPQVITALLGKGALPELKGGVPTQLELAARYNSNPDVARALLNAGSEAMDMLDVHHPLEEAILHNRNTEVAQVLLDACHVADEDKADFHRNLLDKALESTANPQMTTWVLDKVFHANLSDQEIQTLIDHFQPDMATSTPKDAPKISLVQKLNAFRQQRYIETHGDRRMTEFDRTAPLALRPGKTMREKFFSMFSRR
jgi:Ankyrin repeats (3 copies)